MLNEARPYFPGFPHPMLAPGLAIAIVVFGMNLLGDGLRDVLDPRVERQRTPGQAGSEPSAAEEGVRQTHAPTER